MDFGKKGKAVIPRPASAAKKLSALKNPPPFMQL
jgi:hypothetical protein